MEDWKAIAKELRRDSLAAIYNLEDTALKRLLMKGDMNFSKRAVGTFSHVKLWQRMAESIDYEDKELPHDLLHGFRVHGPVARSHMWPALDPFIPPVYDEAAMDARAWEVQQRVRAKLRQNGVGEHTKGLWDDMLADVDKAFCTGPIFSEREVAEHVGSEAWFPMPRFPVIQGDGSKVRGVDDASVSGSQTNLGCAITERLAVPGTDQNIATLRALQQSSPGRALGGWIVDESKAYRQIPTRPQERRFSVIAMLEPGTGRLGYFIMNGHAFGQLHAVYNYNRRVLLLTTFLSTTFHITATNYYDDRYAFTWLSLADSERDLVLEFCGWLGVDVAMHKVQSGSQLDILGIRYDLTSGRILVLPERRQKLREIIFQVLRSGSLHPAAAAKLKGKLTFVASHYKGRLG